eukprot:2311356-Rhodomonas_salina.1
MHQDSDSSSLSLTTTRVESGGTGRVHEAVMKSSAASSPDCRDHAPVDDEGSLSPHPFAVANCHGTGHGGCPGRNRYPGMRAGRKSFKPPTLPGFPGTQFLLGGGYDVRRAPRQQFLHFSICTELGILSGNSWPAGLGHRKLFVQEIEGTRVPPGTRGTRVSLTPISSPTKRALEEAWNELGLTAVFDL